MRRLTTVTHDYSSLAVRFYLVAIIIMQKLGEFVLTHDEVDESMPSGWLLNPLNRFRKPRSKKDGMSSMDETKTDWTEEYGSDEENNPRPAIDDDISTPDMSMNEASMGSDIGKYSYIAASLIFFFPALGGLLFGYDIGATSAVVAQLQTSYSGVEWSEAIVSNSSLQGAITAMGTLGALFGSIACFAVADHWGRRRSLLVASCLYLIGAALEVGAGDPHFTASSGIALLIIGRLVYGFGIGFAMNGAPAYIGEMAPSAIRGFLLSLKEVFVVIGIIFGYLFGYIFAEQVGGWRYVYGLSMPFAVIMFFGMLSLPYSARWLALKGRVNEARMSLKFVTPNLPESELEAVRDAADKARLTSHKTSFSDDYSRLTSPTVFPALVAGVGLVFFQQITGQPSVLYYANSIFADVGLASYGTILVSVFKLLATLVTTFSVDKHGRKVMLYVGCSLMLAALIMLGTAFLYPYSSGASCNAYVSDNTCSSACVWNTARCGTSTCIDAGFLDASCTCCGADGMTPQKTVILTALFVYIGGYQVGFGPISWLLISEIFPLEVRGKAVSLAVVTNFFWNTVITFIFPVELEYIGSPATFFIYAGVLIVSVFFIYRKVPETKGMTLEQIEEFFVHSSKISSMVKALKEEAI